MDLADTPDWVRDAVFYQIFPDRFASSSRVQKPGPLEPWDTPPTTFGFKGGDLLGIVEHLDYIQGLGVTALYLNPVFSSASNHRYHTYDYYQVDPLLGGNDALRELLDACHARGMRVVLDGVFNHSGRGFWPFHHIVETGASSPYVDWFYIDQEALLRGKQLHPYPTPAETREMSRASGEHHAGDASLRHLGYRAWWDLPALPKLNTNNAHLREHLMGAAEHWLRFGIDGWRLDVAEEIDAGFWREFRQRVRATRDDAYIVAEIWREKPEWVSGDTFDGLMNYPLTEALLSFTAARTLDMKVVSQQHEYRDFVRPIDGPTFATRVEQLLMLYRPEATAAQLNLLGSHDTPRYVTVAGGDRAAYRLALLAVMTLPGAPCIYYGDEIGMEGRHDPANRGSFVWDEARWDSELVDFVRCLTSMRSAHSLLRSGAYRTLAAERETVAYGRFADGSGAVVVLNAANNEAAPVVHFEGAADAPTRPIALPGWGAAGLERVDGGLRVRVGKRSGALVLVGESAE